MPNNFYLVFIINLLEIKVYSSYSDRNIMETDKVAVIAHRIEKELLPHTSGENLTIFFYSYLSDKFNVNGRVLLDLGDYLTKYSRKFDRVRCLITVDESLKFPNGVLPQSKFDIGIDPFIMDNTTMVIMDFAFPYHLDTSTLMARKARYKPQIFGILQTFSLPL